MLESEFQNKLIQELKRMFKGCIVTKLDASHIQGIPDLLILYNVLNMVSHIPTVRNGSHS